MLGGGRISAPFGVIIFVVNGGCRRGERNNLFHLNIGKFLAAWL